MAEGICFHIRNLNRMKNDIQTNVISLKEKMLHLHSQHLTGLNEAPFMKKIRENALESFQKNGFPHNKMEDWRSTNLSKTLAMDFKQHFEPGSEPVNIDSIFSCDVHHLDTYLITLLNGWYSNAEKPLNILPDGTIIGSFAKASVVYPEIFEKYYAKTAEDPKNGMNALNTAFAQDGVFIYVPDNVKVDKTIQIVSIINLDENILIQPRNLVVVGKNAQLQLVHCDHSVQHRASFINSVTEIFIEENAEVEYYKLQNKDNETTLITTTYFEQAAHSRLTSNVITLNGGLIRNNMRVSLNGAGADAKLLGLYLMDREQHVDNNLFIDHRSADCTSTQLYKGILDDQAEGVFNGHILVRPDAQRTQAYQNSKNILLTDKANIHTQPQLEIYADDVKCSHGATVGQLDPEAMFYMRSRGIREDTARMLMMYAFAAEVINQVKILPLRHQIDEMIYKRLKGELSTCDQCILDCNAKRDIHFEIDLKKI